MLAHRYLFPAFADAVAAATDISCGCNNRFQPLCKETKTSATFTFFPGPASYKDARAQCQSLGGDLASIHSEAENSEAYAVARQDTWIGMNDIATEGNHVWSDGSTVDYAGWAQTDPAFQGKTFSRNNDCVGFVQGMGDIWFSSHCDRAFGFLCRGTGGTQASSRFCIQPTCAEAKPHCHEDTEAGKLSRRMCPVKCGCAEIGSPLLRIGETYGCPRTCRAAHEKQIADRPCFDSQTGSAELTAYANQLPTGTGIEFEEWWTAMQSSILEYGCAAAAGTVFCNISVAGRTNEFRLKTLRQLGKTLRHLCP